MFHVGAARQVPVYTVTLHPAPATVNDPHLAKAAFARRLEIGVDDVPDVLGGEVVQVDRVPDRDLDRLLEDRLVVLTQRGGMRVLKSLTTKPGSIRH